MATKGHPDEEDCGSPVADPTAIYSGRLDLNIAIEVD
jgi:hypothetical protein